MMGGESSRLMAIRRMFGGALAALVVLAAPAAAKGANRQSLPQLKCRTGDFDVLRKRRTVRMLTPFSDTEFFLDRGRPHGVAVEFGRALEDWLNKRQIKGNVKSHFRIHVVIEPLPRGRLEKALKDGCGDILAANLTITPERAERFDFTQPVRRGVKEIVVAGPATPELSSLDDLAGQEVPARPSSSYAAHLKQLSEKLAAGGKPPIDIEPLPDDVEDERILEMVASGLLPMAVIDDYEADLWTDVYPALKARPDLVLNDEGDIAWALRKNSPLLKKELDAFLDKHGLGKEFSAVVFRRYFGGTHSPKPATSPAELAKFTEFGNSFRAHAAEERFDWLLLVAQGYQESQLTQSRRSPRGAVGVMQLLPRTAAAPPINVPNIAASADANIKAGALYMRYLMDRYVSEPGPDDLNRTLFTFAAYNAGPGNLRKFRRTAAEMGLDSNVWTGNVEQAAAKIVGRETVEYVDNIYKYFIAYDLTRAEMQRRKAESPSPATPAASDQKPKP